MSDTGSHEKEGKSIQTHIMDQYSATIFALRHCEKLYDDETNAYRFANHEKVKFTEAFKKTEEEVQKVYADQRKASEDFKDNKNKLDKKRTHEDSTLKGLQKRLRKQRQALTTHEGDMWYIEKRRWDAFTSLAALTKKRDQLQEEALKQREKEDARDNNGSSEGSSDDE